MIFRSKPGSTAAAPEAPDDRHVDELWTRVGNLWSLCAFTVSSEGRTSNAVRVILATQAGIIVLTLLLLYLAPHRMIPAQLGFTAGGFGLLATMTSLTRAWFRKRGQESRHELTCMHASVSLRDEPAPTNERPS